MSNSSSRVLNRVDDSVGCSVHLNATKLAARDSRSTVFNHGRLFNNIINVTDGATEVNCVKRFPVVRAEKIGFDVSRVVFLRENEIPFSFRLSILSLCLRVRYCYVVAYNVVRAAGLKGF